MKGGGDIDAHIVDIGKQIIAGNNPDMFITDKAHHDPVDMQEMHGPEMHEMPPMPQMGQMGQPMHQQMNEVMPGGGEMKMDESTPPAPGPSVMLPSASGTTMSQELHDKIDGNNDGKVTTGELGDYGEFPQEGGKMRRRRSGKSKKSKKSMKSKKSKKSKKTKKGKKAKKSKTAKKQRKGKRKSKKAGRRSGFFGNSNSNRFAYTDMQFARQQAARKEKQRNEEAKIRQMLAAKKAQTEAQAKAQTAAPSPQSVTGQPRSVLVSQAEYDEI